MGPSCPKCGALLEQDFGVVSCAQCGSMLSIDLDGQVQIAGAEGASVESFSSAGPDEVVDFPQEPSEFSAETSNDLLPTNESESASTTLAQAIEEIVEYGNQELSLSPISYDLIIENIDDKDTRDLLKEILSDPRLKLKSQAMIDSIQGGVLEIKNINPVVTHWIVKKMLTIPVKISWRQHVYS